MNHDGGGGDSSVNIGGRDYPIVKIGNQVWLAENLDFKYDVNGSQIPIGLESVSSIEPRGNYYYNDETTYGANGNKYGLLYNWPAVKYLNDHRADLIPGWHVPTADEWNALATAVGGTSVAGTKLKSTTDWSSGAGTDDYGFSTLPAGYYKLSFIDLGSYAYFWTATENSSKISNAYCRKFSTDASLTSYSLFKDYQFSVRLVKDT